jgi:hypothetical protein
MCHKATIGALYLLLVSCAQDSSHRSLTEIARERDSPVGTDGKKLPNNTEREREFKVFWTGFRQDVLSKDWASLIARVDFPLKTRASLDSDPVIDVDEEEFQRVFSAFLAGEDPSHFGENEETLIRELRSPNPYIVDSWVRVGDMQFARRDDGWKLYWIYFDAAAMHQGANKAMHSNRH